jgi:hypothetical protein
MTEAGRKRITAGTALLALIAAGAVHAVAAEPEPPRGVLSLQFDNDLFAGSDQNYTSGFRIAYAAPMGPSHPLESTARALPLMGGPTRVTYSLDQQLYTPRDISASQPIPTDQPYAGYLYVGIGFESEPPREQGSRILTSAELQIGVVGPAALGEQTQQAAHKIFDSDEANGWDNQLKNEPAINLFYDRVWIGWYETRIGEAGRGYGIDLSPHIGAALGNVYTYASGGATLRFGPNLPASLGPRSLRPGPPGSGYYRTAPDARWHLFLSLEGRAVARNIFLDGNTFTDSQSVDKYPFVGEARMGIAMTLGRYRLTYAQAFRTKQFHGQDAESFGSVSISTDF